LFNVLSTLLLLPFNRALIKLSEWTIPERKGEFHPELTPIALDARLYGSPALAIAQARVAVSKMAELVGLLCRDALRLMLKHNADALRLAQSREDMVDKMEVMTTNYLVGIARLELSEQESREATTLLTFVGEFERIGDYAINIIERSGEVYDKKISFSDTAKHEMRILSNAVNETLKLTVNAFKGADMEQAVKVEPLEETIDEIFDALRERHIERLKAGACNIEAGIVFLEALTNFERISDHCSNVAARLIGDANNNPDAHTLLRELHLGRESDYNDMIRHYRERYVLP
jgi:phosphate:Na+ symporter